MIFIYNITEVNICVSLREHHDVTFAENDAAAYTQCLGFHRKMILTAILLKFSQTNLKIMYIKKKRKLNILIKNTIRAFLCDTAQFRNM